MTPMTIWKLFFVLLFAIGLAPAQADQADREPNKRQETIVKIDEAHIPDGYTAQSDVYITVGGWFPNSCYQWRGAAVAHRGTNIHYVVATALVDEGWCLMMVTRYLKPVRLGFLGPGEHLIRFMNEDGTYLERTLTLN